MNNRKKYQTDNHNSQVSAKACAQASLLFAIFSITTCFLILYLRKWDPEIQKQCFGILAYPVFIFGVIATAILKEFPIRYVMPLGILGLYTLPRAANFIGLWLLAGFLFSGLTLLVYSCWATRCAENLRDIFKFLFVSTALATFYFLVVNGLGYAGVFSDLIGIEGTLHKDTLFHSAIINMLNRYGVPSIGLDGVKPIVYHIGVHRWVAANLGILGGSTPVLLSITQQVAMLPVFFFTIIILVIKLFGRAHSLTVPLCLTFGSLWVIDSRIWNSYLGSESYLLSLIIMVAMLPMGKNWMEQIINGNLKGILRPIDVGIFAAAIIVCCSVKISTGIILGVYLLACITMPLCANNHRFLLISIILSIAGIIGLLVINSYFLDYSYDFSLFYFARRYPAVFIWQVIISGLSIWAICSFSENENSKTLYIKISALLVTLLAGQLPALIFKVHGGAGFYFSNPAVFIAILYGICSVAEKFEKENIIRLRIPLLKSFVNGNGRPSLQIRNYIFCYVLIGLSLVIVLNTSADQKGYSRYIRKSIENIKTYRSYNLKEIYQNGLVENRGPSISTIEVKDGNMEKREKRYQLTPIGYIKKTIDDMKIKHAERGAAIYISSDYKDFWSSRKRCWVPPFMIPALIGMPLLNGVRSGVENCQAISIYGMIDYGENSLNKNFSQTEICNEATEKGFQNVFYVTENSINLLNCKEI